MITFDTLTEDSSQKIKIGCFKQVHSCDLFLDSYLTPIFIMVDIIWFIYKP